MERKRSRFALWIAALAIVAAALAAVRSCGTGEPKTDEAPERPRPDAADTARAAPPRKPPARKRGVPDETTTSPATDVSKPGGTQTQAPAPRETPKPHELRVVRADGTPAAGVQVVWPQRSLWSEWPGPTMWALRKTDAEGRAQVPGGEGPLYVRLGSEAGWSYRAGSVVPLPDVVLKPGLVVRGRAIDSLSCPVPGANVRAEMFPPGAGASIVVETTSDADGAFELPPLPFDERENGRQDIEIVAYADGLVPGSASTTRTDAPKGPVVVTLYRGAALRGRLVRSDGKALSPVRVLLAGTHLAAFPGEDGRFELRLPAAGGDVIVQGGLQATSESVLRPAAGTFVAARRLGAFRGDAGDRDLGDVVVDGGRPLRGVVVLLKSEPFWEKAFPRAVALMDGGPVADARVTAVLAGTEILSVTTDATGAFEMPLSDDAHDLVVHERTSNRFGGPPAVEGVRGGGPDVRIVRGRMGVRVRLRDENGAKAEFAEVSLGAQIRGEKWSVGWPTPDGWRLPRSEARIQVPTEGAWDVTVHAPGFEDVTLESVDVRTDRDAEIDVRLKKKP